jgi:hypothetical protein
MKTLRCDTLLRYGYATDPHYACIAPPCQKPKLPGINAAN